jgi:hypothetical protein
MKVLLVGNGPSALESPMGSRIDSNEFDAVLRFNRGHKLDDGTLNTGVIGIHFAVNHFEEVYIYGFDTYDFKYDNLHYFENKPNKFKFNQTPDHNPDKEKYYIDYMVNNNKIKILT